MAKHGSSHRRRRSNRRSPKRGGGGNYSSASSYGTYVNGSGDSQYDRVFAQGSPNQSNVIVGAQGQWATQPGTPTNTSMIQSAGKKRSGSRKNRRGGLVGEVLSQALVPFGILALQQSYRKKRGGKTRRR